VAEVILERVSKNYPGSGKGNPPKEVLQSIDLAVADGEFLVLVGPSGCGKSTLLRTIAGLETTTDGSISIGGRVVDGIPPAERDIAMVFQSYALYPHMRVYDNIAFGLRRAKQSQFTTAASKFPPAVENFLVEFSQKFPRSWRYTSPREREVERRVQKVAAMLQIETLLERYPKQLSGGQKQRVALGRAIARDASVFLMDEPLSNLDPHLRAETRSQIVNLQHQLGTTTIYVTHDRTEAMTMGDRIAIVYDGKIQQIAAPLEVYEHPANTFVAQFIGALPMNLLPVQMKTPLLATSGEFRLMLPEIWSDVVRENEGKALTLGIRPEHLTLSAPANKNLRAKVDRLEALGTDTFITARWLDSQSGETTLQIRCDPERKISIGEEIWLSITTEKIHLFDPHTTKAILPGN
jgi:multiple sugar transport system ATP-binding protein